MGKRLVASTIAHAAVTLRNGVHVGSRSSPLESQLSYIEAQEKKRALTVANETILSLIFDLLRVSRATHAPTRASHAC